MNKLSQQAQAVLDAFGDARDGEYVDGVWVVNERTMIAAALRAAADQVAPEYYNPSRGVSYPEKEAFIDGKCVRNEDIRYAILAIADELEAQ